MSKSADNVTSHICNIREDTSENEQTSDTKNETKADGLKPATNFQPDVYELMDRHPQRFIFDYSSWQSIGSGQESDVEDNVHSEIIIEPSISSKGYDPSIDDKLPETVSLLTTPSGSKLYLIGTAHFSEESINDVSKIIQAVQPHRVIVELCQARLRVLLFDEESLLEEARKLNFQNILALIKESGVFSGMMHVLMLNLSAHITKELGMAPGGEFRRAFLEARKVPNCIVGFGDRPIHITMQRLLGILTLWQKIKLGWNLLLAPCVTKEEVEKCKRRDFLEQIMSEMAREYPAVTEVFVNERDLFLTHSLQLACKPVQTPNGVMPVRVVGVVGIGHADGITKLWGKVKKSQIPPILSVPPRSLTSKIIRLSIKVSMLGAVIYIGYRIIPVPSFLSYQSMKSSVMGLLKVNKVIQPIS